MLVELERLVNRAVWDSRDVSWEEIPTEEARSREDVAFNTKTEDGVMADADEIRVVTIDGWDVAACGGTHVSNTLEIGPVSVLDRSNPGEGLTRVEFAVGGPGIDYRASVREAALDAAREIGVGVTDLADGVRSLRTENDRLSSTLSALRGELLDDRLRAFESVDHGGVTWRIGTLSGFDANDVGEAAKTVTYEESVVVAAVGADDRPFVVVASETAVHAGDVVDRITNEFGGGGGGGPPFAQGGGLDASPDEVVEFLRTATFEPKE
jgi:alanyl-tRNA synthetase